ncbi:alpha/beta hydrolase [Shewanella sedimentimangrovi]|uniref:Alpha/beta hydrolase n=1 Tax=Shewanella sedimentimangrovi TaxID=2814293 RepID=A0ABX7QZM5_9GAMM|nr:alpha/beta hydrolase-fold protein [Shewanella sedimentimangrovi]QSX36268.1 alpha/beta hydrolase [Shewanella sedimentimangrovi]
MNKILLLIFIVLISVLTPAVYANGTFEIKNSEIHTIDSKVLGRKYDLYIKLPNDYFDKANESKRYPVLYLNDGPYTFKVAAGVTHFTAMDKAIVVGISFADGDDGQFSRVRDLTPEKDKSWVKYETGGAPEYLKFIEQEVFTFVENKYRINVNKRILSGQSLGGSFGAWVLLTKPELFSDYILTSPSLWFKDDLIFAMEEKYFSQHKSIKAKVFIATGALEIPEFGSRNDMVDGHQRFLQRLRSRHYQGLQLIGEVIDGTDHYSTFPVGLAKGLRWIYQDL